MIAEGGSHGPFFSYRTGRGAGREQEGERREQGAGGRRDETGNGREEGGGRREEILGGITVLHV